MDTDDIEALATFIRQNGYSRIGVDGTDGSGKSTIARGLSEKLGITHLNLDDYLVKEQGGFLGHLKYGELKQEMLTLKGFVVDGVCLLKVLEKINTPVGCLVYVKRMSHGRWADDREYDITENVEEFIRKEREMAGFIEGSDAPVDSLGLAEEIIRYHAEYKPHHRAKVFFMREVC